jgi:hypothetical protein
LSATSSAGSSGVGAGADRGQVGLGRLERVGQGRGVAPVGGVDLGGDDGAGVEVDRVLGLVGEAGAAVLQLGDPGLGSLGEVQSAFDRPLAFALAVEPDQVLGRRRRDPARLGQPLEHLPVALAGVAPHDRAQGGVGLHGRGVDADPLALDQAVLGQPPQHPGEDRLVRLQRQPRAGLAQPRVVGHRLGGAEPQELAQRQAVRAAPLQAALAVDPLEVADQVHAEVAPGRDRWPAPPAGVVGRTLTLGEAVEAGLDQDRLQPVVEGVPGRAWQLRPPTIRSVCRPFCRPSAMPAPAPSRPQRISDPIRQRPVRR